MRIAAAILSIFLAAPSMAADSFCRALPADSELPAGFSGAYQVIGRSAKGVAYSGTGRISIRDNAFWVTRAVAGVSTGGSAAFEECGMDKIRFFRVSYREGGATTVFACRLGADGDNYYRLTCRSAQGRLEAWFQDQ